MIRIARIVGLAVIAAGAALPALAASAPPAASFYPFVGNWKGQGGLAEPGKAPVKLTFSMSCRKDSDGWAVSCRVRAKNKSMTIAETDLMGVDPVTGKAHVYTVTNLGETHDHEAAWTDSKTLTAHYAWAQEGRQMREDATFDFSKKGRLLFQSTTSADGKPVSELSVTLAR